MSNRKDSTADAGVIPDVQTRALLDAFQQSGLPSFEQMGVEEARQSLRQAVMASDVPEQEIHRIEERKIATGKESIPARFYWPLCSDKKTSLPPVVLFIHGGGWVLGDLDIYENYCKFICHYSEAVIVSVDYRLAPEHKFPAGLDDCYTALTWLVAEAGNLGIDKTRIAIAGDSAGGNLCAALCQLSRQEKFPYIACQVLINPLMLARPTAAYPSREKFGRGDFFISLASLAWSIELYLTDPGEAENPLASPVLAPDLSNLPPAIIVTSGFDPLHDEGEDYAQRLRQAEVTVEYRCFPSTIHGFMSFAGVLDVGKEGLRFVSKRIRDFFSAA